MKPDWTCILFDLDGTITDSAPGITSSLRWMFGQLGLPVPSEEELLEYVGPPILDSFRDLAGFDAEAAMRALGTYRVHYTMTGLYDSRVYEGMRGCARRREPEPPAALARHLEAGVARDPRAHPLRPARDTSTFSPAPRRTRCAAPRRMSWRRPCVGSPTAAPMCHARCSSVTGSTTWRGAAAHGVPDHLRDLGLRHRGGAGGCPLRGAHPRRTPRRTARELTAQRARRSTTPPNTRGKATATGTMAPRSGDRAAATSPLVSIRKSRVTRRHSPS